VSLKKRPIEMNVVEAAEARVRHLYDSYDTVVISFSGGKDSLITLHLCLAEAHRRNRLPLEVVFFDEEFVPQSVIDLVLAYGERDDIRLRWLHLPSASERLVCGERIPFVIFDPARAWARQPPAFSEGSRPGDPAIFDKAQYQARIFETGSYRGKVADVIGLRACESLNRYRAVTQRVHLNWISAAPQNGTARYEICKPIYDWLDADCFAWLAQEGIAWAEHYEGQHLAGARLRTGPLHVEGSKMDYGERKLLAYDPELYARTVKVFPDLAVMGRYWQEFDADGLIAEYIGEGWAGARRYIQEKVTDPGKRAEARLLLTRAQGSTTEAHTPADVIRQIASGRLDLGNNYLVDTRQKGAE